MRDTFVVKQDFERFAAKLVCCWTYYLDVMDGGDSSWATISFALFSALYFFARLYSQLFLTRLCARRSRLPAYTFGPVWPVSSFVLVVWIISHLYRIYDLNI